MVKNIPILDLGDAPPQWALVLCINELETHLRETPTLPPDVPDTEVDIGARWLDVFCAVRGR
eukprot:7294567-Prorocentrum_lima.AAC.1